MHATRAVVFGERPHQQVVDTMRSGDVDLQVEFAYALESAPRIARDYREFVVLEEDRRETSDGMTATRLRNAAPT